MQRLSSRSKFNGLDPVSKQAIKDIEGFSRPWRRRLASMTGSILTKELMYQNTVHLIYKHHNFEGIPFCYGSAANYGLLYLIYRIVSEQEVRRVVEFGAGQSTLLLDQISSKIKPLSITTLEHDNVWREQLRTKVQHEIVLSDLCDVKFRDEAALGYPVDIDLVGSTDLLVVDGPHGTRQKSRWGAGAAIEKLCEDEFIVIFDDAERRGEWQTISAVLDMLWSKEVKFYLKAFFGSSFQLVISSPKYQSVQTF